MKFFISLVSLIGLISISSAAILVGEGSAIPEPGQVIPPVVPEPRQAIPPVVPEPRQSTCQFSYDFTSIGQQALLRSPNYPNTYPAFANCKYSLISPAGSTIQITCNDFNVEASSGCQYDKLSVSLSGNANLEDAIVICGKGTFERTSTTNALTVGFTSDSSNPASSDAYRYSCTLTVIGSSAPVTSTTTTLAPVTTTTTAPVTTTTITPSPSSATVSNSTCTCGLRNEAPRIVGGGQALVNEFPWRCNLYSPTMGAFCGATVISSRWILTAAHCTAAVTKNNAQSSLYVGCGDHDLTTTSEAVNQVVKVSKIVQHASYNNETEDNDMALLQLEAPLALSRTVQPVCLPWNLVGKSVSGTTVVASGWGTTSSGGSPSMILKKVDLPALTTQECQAYYGTAVTNNMICTYNPGQDTCQGDSGGSIDYKDPITGRYNSVGVVSWGVGCAGTRQPGVYAYVNNYLGWIQTQTGETFCKA